MNLPLLQQAPPAGPTLGTAAAKNTGTSGDAVPLLDQPATFSGNVEFTTLPVNLTYTASTDYSNGLNVRKRGADGDATAAVASGGELGYHSFYGWNGSAYQRGAFVVVSAAEAYGSSWGSYYDIYVTGVGNTWQDRQMRVGAGVSIGNPTGGLKGYGSLNAQNVYDDDSLLSCYVFDAALDGEIDEAKWDAKVPDRRVDAVYDRIEVDTGEKDAKGDPILGVEYVERRAAMVEPRAHGDMRKFKSRIGGKFDPLDIDKYTAHWRKKRHLTSMPNEETFDAEAGLSTGQWIQRLVETVEIQAVHIAALNDRLKVLEARRK